MAPAKSVRPSAWGLASSRQPAGGPTDRTGMATSGGGGLATLGGRGLVVSGAGGVTALGAGFVAAFVGVGLVVVVMVLVVIAMVVAQVTDALLGSASHNTQGRGQGPEFANKPGQHRKHLCIPSMLTPPPVVFLLPLPRLLQVS
jgi:hypothetical protein